ncbi:UNVERIFIED_CONTAM: hypothetical protein Slati_4300700 [Sesamum latifolium]|uniref:Uncharacterized protein n=1 Tax=Sesamum latifolium TaxID=2727402 RepID=A0AAW2TEW9_9LAMI
MASSDESMRFVREMPLGNDPSEATPLDYTSGRMWSLRRPVTAGRRLIDESSNYEEGGGGDEEEGSSPGEEEREIAQSMADQAPPVSNFLASASWWRSFIVLILLFVSL